MIFSEGGNVPVPNSHSEISSPSRAVLRHEIRFSSLRLPLLLLLFHSLIYRLLKLRHSAHVR
jgi:hypothetical protein